MGRGGSAGRAAPTSARRHPDDDQIAAAKSVCLTLLAARAYSRAELAERLKKRGIPDDAAASALDRLEQVGLVDDAGYAQGFVASRHRDRGLGRAALRRELHRKGIDKGVIEEAVSAVDEDAEKRRAAALVASRLDSALFAGPEKARRRLMGLLARRGYSASVAVVVINDALRGFAEPADIPLDE